MAGNDKQKPKASKSGSKKPDELKEQALSETLGKYQKMLFAVLGITLIGPILGVFLLLSAKSTLGERAGLELLTTTETTYDQFKESDIDRRIAIADVNREIASQRLDVAESNILIMADSLYIKERDIQLFYRLLKVNAYSLTEHFFGVHAWFEKYGGEIDNAIQRSQSRQLRLLQIQEFYQDA